NILPIHDVNLDREFPYVVTELSPNGSAAAARSDAARKTRALVLELTPKGPHADGSGPPPPGGPRPRPTHGPPHTAQRPPRAADSQRVYHGGLKPEQLLIDGYGNVKVSDFGFQRIVERDHAVIRQVYVGMGNVAYMAPELYTDPMSAGPQADIYALGIIFYELLTRKLPGRRSPMPSQFNTHFPKG